MSPNYTQIPNSILDNLGEFTDSELRVILAISRQVFGYHKEKARMSISFISKAGGLSRHPVIAAVKSLEEAELITREFDKMGTGVFSMKIDDGSAANALGVVQQMHRPASAANALKERKYSIKENILCDGAQRKHLHCSIIDGWSKVWFEAFSRKYVFTVADGKQLKEFLVRNPETDAMQFVKLAENAWCNPKLWESKFANSIALFVTHYNEVEQAVLKSTGVATSNRAETLEDLTRQLNAAEAEQDWREADRLEKQIWQINKKK